jgi:hypothetical protein
MGTLIDANNLPVLAEGTCQAQPDGSSVCNIRGQYYSVVGGVYNLISGQTLLGWQNGFFNQFPQFFGGGGFTGGGFGGGGGRGGRGGGGGGR